MSFTEDSETESLHMGNKRLDKDPDPMEVTTKFYPHPFAERLSPYEDYKQKAHIQMENMVTFLLFDFIGKLIALISILFFKLCLIPMAGVGLLNEGIRKCLKCKKNT